GGGGEGEEPGVPERIHRHGRQTERQGLGIGRLLLRRDRHRRERDFGRRGGGRSLPHRNGRGRNAQREAQQRTKSHVAHYAVAIDAAGFPAALVLVPSLVPRGKGGWHLSGKGASHLSSKRPTVR